MLLEVVFQEPLAALVDLRASTGRLPGGEWPTLARHRCVTLSGREANSEEASGLALVQATLDGIHHFPAQII